MRNQRVLGALALGGVLVIGLWMGLRPGNVARQPQASSLPEPASPSGELAADAARAAPPDENPERTSSELPPPQLHFHGWDSSFEANTPIPLPPLVHFDVRIQFAEELEMNSLKGRVAVVPEEALDGLRWTVSENTDPRSREGKRTVTRSSSVSFRLNHPMSSTPLVITFSPGIRGQSGRLLAEEARFELVVAGKGPPRIVLEGRGYEEAGDPIQEVRTTNGESMSSTFISGPATLHIDFLVPVDTERVGAAVATHFTTRGFTVDPPEWDDEGQLLTLPIRDMPAGTEHFFDTRDLTNVPGLPTASSSLRWLVAPAFTVYRSPGQLAESVPIGTFSQQFPLTLAGSRVLHDKRLLTFQSSAGGDCDCETPVLLELTTGKQTPLHSELCCVHARGGWFPGGEKLLVSAPDQGLLQVYVHAYEEELRFFRGNVVGAALSPTGQVAVFTLLEPIRGKGGPTGIALSILESDGRVHKRVGRVSAVWTEDEPSPIDGIQADWSDDGSVLAFTRLERGEKRKGLRARLSLWREDLAKPEELTIPALDVSWRRGTHQVLVANEARSLAALYDVQARQLVREGLPWGMLWSPDGRYLAWNEGSDERGPRAWVYDLETGLQQHIHGHAFGWDFADDQFYWAGELERHAEMAVP